MARTEIRAIGSFVAVDDDGDSHTLIIYRTFIDTSNLDHPNTERPGMISVRTEDGNAVNRLAEGEYEVVGLGIKLHSSDPDAV